MPGIWYQMGLHCTHGRRRLPLRRQRLHLLRACPGVVIGHNRDIAWGFTNLDPDVTDLYLEKVTGKTYLYGGRQAAADRARRGDPDRRQAPTSDHRALDRGTGRCSPTSPPSCSSVGANAPVGAVARPRTTVRRRAARGPRCTPRPTADAIFELDTGERLDRVPRARPRDFAVPSQNLVYADTAGNIGYQAPGTDPDPQGRATTGDYPAAGWLPQNDWTGRYVPFDRCRTCSTRPTGSSSPRTRP